MQLIPNPFDTQRRLDPKNAWLVVANVLASFRLRSISRHIRTIAAHGRMAWQKSSGYNSRALVEAAISRYKRIIGGRLRARTLPTQQTEVAIAARVLNSMAPLGMPITERIA